MLDEVRRAEFIALDLELTGLHARGLELGFKEFRGLGFRVYCRVYGRLLLGRV